MLLYLILITPFVMAALAPWVVARVPRGGVWGMAGVAGALTVLLLSQIPAVLAGPSPSAGFDWIPGLGVRFSLRLDALALFVATLVTGVGAVVLQFSSVYFADHPLPGRFYLYLLSFMGAMLGIVLSEDLFLLFVFWELTSITSFLLIGFDHHREAARESALRALLLTGAGGLGLLVAVILIGIAAGTTSMVELAADPALLHGHSWYRVIVILLLLGAFTKSAQFPFHFWLPGAMEAPSPVSAYLHSATMVKAGVFLLARMSPMLGATPLWNNTLLAVGATTMLVGAAMGFAQTDMKRVLAYTTVSVLGVLVALIGLGTGAGFVAMAVFWLAHVFYKAALFLLTGAIDHEFGTRDLRKLGGLRRAAPGLALAGALCALSMWGAPPLLGFLGKELLYEAMLHADLPASLQPAVALGPMVAAMALLGAAGLLAGIRPFFGRRPQAAVADGGHEAESGGDGGHHAGGLPAGEFAAGPMVLAAAGLLMGLAPGLVSPLLHAVAGAALGSPIDGKLALWHGVTPAFLLSVPTLGAAALLAFAWPLLQRPAYNGIELMGRVGPLRCYDAIWSAIKGLAAIEVGLFTRRLLLRHEVMVVIAAVPVMIALSLAAHPVELPDSIQLSPFGIHEAVLAAMVLVAAAVAVHSRSLPGAIAGLGVAGYCVALFFARFGGPDLAMTQFAIETLTVILFVLVIYRLPQPARYTRTVDRTVSAIVALVFGASVAALSFFTALDPADSRITPEFAARSLTEAKGRNVVNVILVDFRALDTLGEITVLGAAALGVYVLMKSRSKRDVGA